MAGPKYPGFDTLALHAGQSPDPATQPGEPPAGEPPAPPRTRPAGPDWVFERLDQGLGYSREVLRRRTAADPLPDPAE